MSAPPPDWAVWKEGSSFTVGAEEEVMLLHPSDWTLAQQSARALARMPEPLANHMSDETQGAVVELSSNPHQRVDALAAELHDLRSQLESELSLLGLRAACAGTHPFTVWQETVVSSAPRYQAVYGSMRELARREPSLALHVHVGIPDPETAISVLNRMRAHLPLLLALSVNSPFWQGRDTGLASARTPLFQAFPRVGIPRVFEDYSDWAQVVDMLIRCEAFPEASFLWWDVRPQPRFGTIEVRILDAQSTVAETAAICALVQCVARLEATEGYAGEKLVSIQEVLDENRFLAARDGMEARLIDPTLERRVPARVQLADLLEACAPHARALGCEAQLASIDELFSQTGAERQVEFARRNPDRLRGLVGSLADSFCRVPSSGESPSGGESSAMRSMRASL
jgi:carboxylate-amine ligase